MIINKDSLRRDTIALMRDIDAQMSEIKEHAKTMGIAPEKMRDTSNGYVLAPLLLAKAQAYHTLVLLQS